MSKGGGGGGTTTQVQKADPWVGLQPALSSLYSGALQNYQSGGPRYYPGQTQAGTNQEINSALSQGVNRSNQGPSPLMNAGSYALQGLMGGRSLADNPVYGTMAQIAGGNMIGSNPAEGYLSKAANGGFLDQQNPYLEGLYKNASDPMVKQFQNAIAPGLASQFSAAGRTGSGAHQSAFDNASNTLGQQLGGLSSSIYGNAYESERGRQQQAAGMLGDINNQQRSMQLKAGEDISDQYGQERARQQAAIMAAPNYAQAGQNMDFDRIAKLMGVGQYQQQTEQNFIDAAKQRYDFGQQQPTLNLQTLNQLLQGGSAYNSQSSKGTSSTDRNPFAGAIGGAAMSSALGGMFGIDAMGGPMGLLGGALLGGLFG